MTVCSEVRVIIDDKLSEASPELIGELFAGMDSDQMAQFFNAVAEVSKNWCLPMQLQYVTSDPGLTLGGRRIMQTIGDYSHWGLSCNLADEVSK